MRQKFKKDKYENPRKYLLENLIDIFGDKVLILNYNEPFSCTMIHDKNTAISFKNFFNQLWKTAKV